MAGRPLKATLGAGVRACANQAKLQRQAEVMAAHAAQTEALAPREAERPGKNHVLKISAEWLDG